MKKTRFVRHFCAAYLLLSLVADAIAQEPDPRVSPVNRPLPVGATSLVPMTGTWRFSLEHGVMLKTSYESRASSEEVFSASSCQDGSLAIYAFDIGDTSNDGRNWCAVNGDMPQWVQADLGSTENVSGIDITWEKSDATYQCKVEGSADGTTFTPFLDKTAAPGIGNGKLTWTPAPARYVRITVTKANAKPYGWACMHDCKIHVLRNGTDVVWKPSGPTAEQIAKQNAFSAPSFSDANWKDMTIPSNWEMLGYSKPLYGSVDDTVGLYRRVVAVPASFGGKRIYWRFDGVFESAEVFVNGKRVGYHESGFTAFDVDLTGYVTPGQPNVFAVRVCKAVPTYDMETGDFEALGGIYRNNFLYAVPPTHISDLTVRTTLDQQYVNATLETDLEVTGTPGQFVPVIGVLADAAGNRVFTAQPLNTTVAIGPDGRGKVTLATQVQKPALWSAEKPNLYKLLFTVSGPSPETIEQPFGFRQIEISPDQVVLWNGVPIKCAGTCRHEIYPTLGSALDDEVWLKDVHLMKGANINAIRTSHYNHAGRFLDLCDQNGFYLLDEIPFCWIQDYVNDPTLIPPLLQRSLETYERDKNRPSVLAWSCGNENPVGSDEQVVLDFMHQHDPSRPAFSSCLNYKDLKGQSFTDFHYPWPGLIDNMVNNDGKHAPIIFSENPHIFWQPTWHKYDPGVADLWGEAISKNWGQVDAHSCFVGSFIWEWQDQPIADSFNDDDKDKATGLRYQNNKGVVTGYREPKPEYWAVKMAYSQVRIDPTPLQPADGSFKVALTNRYSFTNLNELKCSWEARAGNQVLKKGDQTVTCAPLQSTTASFPAPAGTTALQITFAKPSGDVITGAVLKVAGAPDLPPPVSTGPSADLTLQSGDTPKVASSAMEVDFDTQTGQISHWKFGPQDLITGVAEFNLGQGFPNDDTGLKGYLKTGAPVTLSGAKWTSSKKADGLVEAVSVAAVNFDQPSQQVGTLTTTYTVHPDAQIGVQWSLDWKGPEDKAWEIGQELSVPSTLNKLSWSRDSVFSYYPADHMGVPSGHCDDKDIRFRASKRGLHWLTLTNASGTGLALLQLDTPLVGRVSLDGSGTNTLFASREEAGPQDFSGSWVENHAINLKSGTPMTGSYLLRPAVTPAYLGQGN